MSSVISLTQSSFYGLTVDWGVSAFNGSIAVGTWTKQGCFQQNVEYESTTINQWGQTVTHTSTGSVDPVSKLNGSSSYIDGGNTQGGLSVSQLSFNSATSDSYSAYLNLYTLLSPQPGASNTSSTLIAEYPYNYNVLTSGSAYISYDPGSFTFSNAVSDSSVIYQTNQPSLSIANGNLINSLTNLAQGPQLNIAFPFLAQATPSQTITSNIVSSVTSSQTQGTSQSSSTSGSNTAGYSITASETGTVGLDPSDSISETLTAQYNDQWASAWGSTKSANFSETTAISGSTTNSFVQNLDLASAPQTGTSTTANGNVTPLYQYTTTYTDAIGETQTVTFDLILFAQYEWNLQYSQGTIQNITTGQYTLVGSIGSVADNSGNTFGGNIGQAFYWANQGNAWDALGYGYNPIVGFNSSNASNVTSVSINGSTVSTTNASTNIILTLSAVSPSSSTADTSSRSSASPSSAGAKFVNIGDGLALKPEKTRNPTSYTGYAGQDLIVDTNGKDIIKTLGGNDHVILRGNSVQLQNGGDLIYLGAGNDIADLRKANGSEISVHGEEGNDKILDGVINFQGDLGQGNDIFEYGGGADILRLGEGKDTISVKSGKGSLVVADFNVGNDVLTGLGNQGYLSWDESVRAFRIQGSNRVTGTLYTSEDSGKAESPEFWYSLGIQNTAALRLNQAPNEELGWRNIRDNYARYAFSNPKLSTLEWKQFSSDPKKIQTAAAFIAKPFAVGTLTSAKLRDIYKLAERSTSFTGFIAATKGYLTSPKQLRSETTILGTSGDNLIEDTNSQDIIKALGGNDHVKIKGNLIPSREGGDLVKLGAGNDLADLRAAKGNRVVVYGEAGSDTILDGSISLNADLGKGNDLFEYGGGADVIKLGEGRDIVSVAGLGKGSLFVQDFNVGNDVLIGMPEKGYLSWNKSLNAFTIKGSDRFTGTLFTADDSGKAESSEFWYSLGIQNPTALRLKQPLPEDFGWEDIRDNYGRYAFNNSSLATKDWKSFSGNRKNIREAATFISEPFNVGTLTNAEVSDIYKLAGQSTSFTSFITATTGYFANTAV